MYFNKPIYHWKEELLAYIHKKKKKKKKNSKVTSIVNSGKAVKRGNIWGVHSDDLVNTLYCQ